MNGTWVTVGSVILLLIRRKLLMVPLGEMVGTPIVFKAHVSIDDTMIEPTFSVKGIVRNLRQRFLIRPGGTCGDMTSIEAALNKYMTRSLSERGIAYMWMPLHGTALQSLPDGTVALSFVSYSRRSSLRGILKQTTYYFRPGVGILDPSQNLR